MPFTGIVAYACFMQGVTALFDGNGTAYPPYAQTYADNGSFPNWTFLAQTTDQQITFTQQCLSFIGRTDAISILVNTSGDVPEQGLPSLDQAACVFSGMFSKWDDTTAANDGLVAFISPSSTGGLAEWDLEQPGPSPVTQINATCVYWQ